ncbi:hypothetical protein L3V86_04740 [Thiotrichales bacterium 19S11-10]|nr:hypothetical protein [Thiotrichales bacterium 19S11-10]
MFQSIVRNLYCYQQNKDPYLEILYIGMMALIAVSINLLIYIIFDPDDFLLPLMLGSLAVIVCNLPFYKSKVDKVKALLYLYVISLLSFSGTIIVKPDLFLTISWFFILSIILYLTTLKNSLYRLHVSMVLSFMAIFLSLSNGSTYELVTIGMNLSFVFIVSLILTLFYPERNLIRIIIGIELIFKEIKIIINTKDVSLAKERFYRLSNHTLALSNLMKKKVYAVEHHQLLENSIRYLRFTLLSMNTVYLKSMDQSDISQMNDRLNYLITYKKPNPIVLEELNLVADATINAESELASFLIYYSKIKSLSLI